MSPYWPVPYIPDPRYFALDAFVSFCIAVLLAVLVNAEGQAFMAALLGDRRVGAKDRFHFIAFLHLDILGTITYLVGGFGWARPMDIEPSRFPHPRLYTLIARLGGPAANLLLANIAASVVHLLRGIEVDAKVFAMVAAVNLTTAVYNLVPLPPLFAGTVLATWLETQSPGLARGITLAGPYLALALTLLDRLHPLPFFRPWLDPLVLEIFRFTCGS
uniref:Site-2 protease family protein n=1 Tax=Desulfobacca acetoxidans TaxID=60893 RepID=A0A7V4LBN2_9BACT